MPSENNSSVTDDWESTLSQGTEANSEDGEGTEEEDENTADNVAENNPEDNKKLSEITMAEQIRKTFNLTVKFPRILRGLHTNQFFFLDVTDEFYERNYPEIISTISDTKFARFAGFKKGRFFVEKVEEKGGMDGWSTTLTLNPIPPSLAIYSQKQKEAEKALVQAINYEISLTSGGGTGAVTGSVNMQSLEEIYSIAATFTYGGAGTGLSPEKAWEHYQSGGRNFDCYDCSNFLFYCLREKGIPCRIVQGHSPYSGSGTHRVVQINEGGNWHCPQQAWSLTTNLRPFTPEDKYPLTPMLTFDGTNTVEGG